MSFRVALGQVVIGLAAACVICVIFAALHALSNPGRALALLGYMYSYRAINPIGPLLAFGVPAFASTVLSCSVGRLDWARGTLRITMGLCVLHLSYPLCVSYATYDIGWLDRTSMIEMYGINELFISVPAAVAGLVPVLFVREVRKAKREREQRAVGSTTNQP